MVLAERHETPLVNFKLATRCWISPPIRCQRAGHRQFAMKVLTDGTRTRNALQISDELRKLGAELDAAIESRPVVCFAIGAQARSSIRRSICLRMWFLNPSFPDNEVKREQKLVLAAIEREQNTPQFDGAAE